MALTYSRNVGGRSEVHARRMSDSPWLNVFTGPNSEPSFTILDMQIDASVSLDVR